MVAETAKGADHVNAVVRMRQSGVLDEHLMLYRVDDLEGHIKVTDGYGHVITLSPGDAGYAAAATQRAYQDVHDKITIDGPGYGPIQPNPDQERQPWRHHRHVAEGGATTPIGASPGATRR